MIRPGRFLPALLLPLAVACGATVHGGGDDDADDGTPLGEDDGASNDGASSGGGSADDGSSDDGSDDGGCTPCECGVNPPLCGLGHAPAPGCDANGEWVCAPYECPSLGAMIEDGDPCDVEGLLCEMEAGCGPIGNIRCIDGRWRYEGERCTPEPVACGTVGEPDACAAAGCRWLAPGCGDETTPALPEPGCHALVGCDELGCPIDMACEQVMVDPGCGDEGCDACGVGAHVCVAANGG